LLRRYEASLADIELSEVFASAFKKDWPDKAWEFFYSHPETLKSDPYLLPLAIDYGHWSVVYKLIEIGVDLNKEVMFAFAEDPYNPSLQPPIRMVIEANATPLEKNPTIIALLKAGAELKRVSWVNRLFTKCNLSVGEINDIIDSEKCALITRQLILLHSELLDDALVNAANIFMGLDAKYRTVDLIMSCEKYAQSLAIEVFKKGFEVSYADFKKLRFAPEELLKMSKLEGLNPQIYQHVFNYVISTSTSFERLVELEIIENTLRNGYIPTIPSQGSSLVTILNIKNEHGIFIKAVETGNLYIVERLLELGIDANTIYDSGNGRFNALLIAAKYGQPEVLARLLKVPNLMQCNRKVVTEILLATTVREPEQSTRYKQCAIALLQAGMCLNFPTCVTLFFQHQITEEEIATISDAQTRQYFTGLFSLSKKEFKALLEIIEVVNGSGELVKALDEEVYGSYNYRLILCMAAKELLNDKSYDIINAIKLGGGDRLSENMIILLLLVGVQVNRASLEQSEFENIDLEVLFKSGRLSQEMITAILDEYLERNAWQKLDHLVWANSVAIDSANETLTHYNSFKSRVNVFCHIMAENEFADELKEQFCNEINSAIGTQYSPADFINIKPNALESKVEDKLWELSSDERGKLLEGINRLLTKATKLYTDNSGQPLYPAEYYKSRDCIASMRRIFVAAICEGQAVTVRQYIEYDRSALYDTYDGCYPIQLAIKHGKLEAFEELCEAMRDDCNPEWPQILLNATLKASIKGTYEGRRAIAIRLLKASAPFNGEEFAKLNAAFNFVAEEIDDLLTTSDLSPENKACLETYRRKFDLPAVVTQPKKLSKASNYDNYKLAAAVTCASAFITGGTSYIIGGHLRLASTVAGTCKLASIIAASVIVAGAVGYMLGQMINENKHQHADAIAL
jgi:hypothetical protein